MKILYIEDNQELAELTKQSLEIRGFEVHWIPDRSKTPTSLCGFDFVLSDYNVPGGDFKALRDQCGRENVPLLLVSGNPTAETQHPHFIPKPYGALTLIGAIELLLAG